MGTATPVSTPGRRLKDTDAGRSQCASMHCSLFLTQGSTIKKTLSVYEGSFRGDPGPGTSLAVANKYFAPYIQPNHDPLLPSTDNLSKLTCYFECLWVKQRWWPFCCCIICPSQAFSQICAGRNLYEPRNQSGCCSFIFIDVK